MYMYRYVHIYIYPNSNTHNAPRFLNKPKYNWFFEGTKKVSWPWIPLL